MCKGAINRHKTIMKACRQLKSTFTDHNQNKSRETVSLSPELACGVSYISKSLAVGSFDCQVDTTAKKGRHQRCTCSWMLQLENLLFTGWPILYLISCVMQIKGHRFPTKGSSSKQFQSGVWNIQGRHGIQGCSSGSMITASVRNSQYGCSVSKHAGYPGFPRAGWQADFIAKLIVQQKG